MIYRYTGVNLFTATRPWSTSGSSASSDHDDHDHPVPRFSMGKAWGNEEVRSKKGQAELG